jgi:hypothetical protein
MADYEVKTPPNLRSVDCCATCKNVSLGMDGGAECFKFRRLIQTASWPTYVNSSDICDAFEREVRA